jgi:predicted DNA-binding protein with PD1-like motif
VSVQSRRIDRDGGRTFVLVFDLGEEVGSGLLAFAREQRITAASFTAIGALQDVVLGYWEWETKRYRRNPIQEQVEVVSLVGNVARAPDGSPRVHAHLVVGKSDGTAYGGHLLEGHVRPTLEVVLVESPATLQRRTDPVTGLALLSLDSG